MIFFAKQKNRIKNIESRRLSKYSIFKAKSPGFTFSKKRQNGFTLVELLIYMGLLSLMVIIFTEIFVAILDNQLGSKNTSNVADDGRFIYSRFIYDVNRAQTIIEPAGIGSSSSSLSLIIDNQQYTYSLAGSNLMLTSSSSSGALNGYGSSVSALLFTKVGTTSASQTVQINFTVTGHVTSRGIFDKQIFQTTAGLR